MTIYDDDDGILQCRKYRQYRHYRHQKDIIMKNVQIPYDLFLALIQFHLMDNMDAEDQIREGLEDKMDAMVRRQLYTDSKTAPTEEQKEKARQEYLDRAGVKAEFRW